MEAEQTLWELVEYTKWTYIIVFVLIITRISYYADALLSHVSAKQITVSDSEDRLIFLLAAPIALPVVVGAWVCCMVYFGTKPLFRWVVDWMDDWGL